MASKVGISFLDGQNHKLHCVGDALVGSSGAQKTQKKGVLDNLSDSRKPSLTQASEKKPSLTQESKKKPSRTQASKKKPSKHFIQSNASNEEALDKVQKCSGKGRSNILKSQNPLMVMDSAAERFFEEFFAEEEYDPRGKRMLNPWECEDPVKYLDKANIINFLLNSQPDLNSQLNPDECEDPICKYGLSLGLL